MTETSPDAAAPNPESGQFIITPGGGPLRGELQVPGDKSISHRAIMLASLASGTSHIHGFLQGEDSLNTLRAFRSMGVAISPADQEPIRVEGLDMTLQAPGRALYLGNSGTAMRLLCGLLAGQALTAELCGDSSLSARPMQRVIAPLQQMGAHIVSGAAGRPPITIAGGHPLHGIDYRLPVASAQIKSCLLLAGLCASGSTRILEPDKTRDHTERMLRCFGYAVATEAGASGTTVSLRGGGRLYGRNIRIPADVSSAAFFMVAASLVPGSDLLLRNVGVNPTRTGVLTILRLMGADLSLQDERESGGEPIADIRVRAAPLQGITIPPEQVPLAIDEFPALLVAAAGAEGRTVLRGAGELRVKESDRIRAMASGLQKLGARATEREDGMVIDGGTPLRGGVVDSLGDHRIAMAFAIAGLLASAPVTVCNCANVATSFPGFCELAQSVGIPIAAPVKAGASGTRQGKARHTRNSHD